MRTAEILAQLHRASEVCSQLSFTEEPQQSNRSRVMMHEAFQTLSNVMDQAFLPVWQAVVGSSLTKQMRQKVVRNVYLPLADTREILNGRLVRMKAADAYGSSEPFRLLVDRFQVFVSGDSTFKTVRTIANRKHVGLPKQDRESLGPGLVLSAVGHYVVRRMRVMHRMVNGVNEVLVDLEGGSFNPISGAYDLPPPPGAARIASMSNYQIDGVPGEATDFIANAISTFSAVLPEFEELAGAYWSDGAHPP